MKNKKTNKQSHGFQGFGLSFIDVLACGLAAAIILFLIFSTRLHKGADSDFRKEDNTADLKGRWDGWYSLEDGEKLKGSMVFVHFVQIKEPTAKLMKILEDIPPSSVWNLSSLNPKLIDRIEQKSMKTENGISFFLVSDTVLAEQLNFHIPLPTYLGQTLNTVKINAKILEGAGTTGSVVFSGYVEEESSVLLNRSIRVTFANGRTRDEEYLIRIYSE